MKLYLIKTHYPPLIVEEKSCPMLITIWSTTIFQFKIKVNHFSWIGKTSIHLKGSWNIFPNCLKWKIDEKGDRTRRRNFAGVSCPRTLCLVPARLKRELVWQCWSWCCFWSSIEGVGSNPTSDALFSEGHFLVLGPFLPVAAGNVHFQQRWYI